MSNGVQFVLASDLPDCEAVITGLNMAVMQKRAMVQASIFPSATAKANGVAPMFMVQYIIADVPAIAAQPAVPATANTPARPAVAAQAASTAYTSTFVSGQDQIAAAYGWLITKAPVVTKGSYSVNLVGGTLLP